MLDAPEHARTPYRGRFAPSPTGHLHFGSLVAAVGSYLEARRRGGSWLVRMEDVDTPRTVPDCDRLILQALTRFGMEWDEPVVYQSQRIHLYRSALDSLTDEDWVYPCGCTRKEIGGSVYPGVCRRGLPPGKKPRAMRVRTEGQTISLEDPIQGNFAQALETEVGDFVVRRADGLFAYQLAVVVDDADQNVTEIVRGSDLLESTPRQLHLQQILGLPTPGHVHLPVAVDSAGNKLSKQTRALPVDPSDPEPALCRALDFLGHPPPEELVGAPVPELWEWAIAAWSISRVPRRRTIQVQGEDRGQRATKKGAEGGEQGAGRRQRRK